MNHLAKHYENQVSVCTYDVDFSKKMKPAALMAYMQETTAQHCSGTTSGRDYLWGHGIFWALARINIKIHEMPKLGENIFIRTWPKTHDKMFAYREYSVRNIEKTMVLGTSDWILMDIHTRRPCRMSKLAELGVVFPEDQEGAIEERPGKIITSGEIIRTFIKKVSYNDIDMYGHVNNVKYLEWGFETFCACEISGGKIASVQINFTAEAKDGEEVEVTRFQVSPGNHIIEGKNLTTGAKAFQMVLKTQESNGIGEICIN